MGKALVKEVCREMVEYCLPFLSYQEKENAGCSVGEKWVYYCLPVLSRRENVVSYKTNKESELSYEMVLALEGRDEPKVSVSKEEEGEILEETVVFHDVNETAMMETDVATGGGRVEKKVTYSMEKLADFDYLIQNFYRIDKTTTTSKEQLNAKKMLETEIKLTHDATTPQILIYHTHSQEGYVDSVAGDSSTTVVGIGDYLTEILEENYGLSVIHHKGEYDVENRDNAYSMAGPAVEQILAENPSIEVVLDLHRDGVGEDTRLVTEVDGVHMAKIMFVNGLSYTTGVGNIGYLYNPNLDTNLAFSFQTQLAMAEYYPGLSRGVYLKGYRYNMHYCPKTLLIEVGAQTNTFQEAKNAMVPLADVIYKVLVAKP